MTPKDRDLHFWLVQETAFTSGVILGYWVQKHIHYEKTSTFTPNTPPKPLQK